MSLVCPLCGNVAVSKHSQLMTHIKLMHADHPNFMIQCNQQGCKRTFRKFTLYRNHIYAFHGTALDEPTVSPHSCGETRGNPAVTGTMTTSPVAWVNSVECTLFLHAVHVHYLLRWLGRVPWDKRAFQPTIPGSQSLHVGSSGSAFI